MTDLTETLKRIESLLDNMEVALLIAERADIRAILDELERVTGESADLLVALEELRGMHTVALGEWTTAEAKVTSLERELAEAKAQNMRTPGTDERCSACGTLNWNDCTASERLCPIKRAHSPAAKEAK